jgi:hypothetical protein
MATESLMYTEIGARLGVSAHAARALAGRLHLRRILDNQGRARVVPTQSIPYSITSSPRLSTCLRGMRETLPRVRSRYPNPPWKNSRGTGNSCLPPASASRILVEGDEGVGLGAGRRATGTDLSLGVLAAAGRRRKNQPVRRRRVLIRATAAPLASLNGEFIDVSPTTAPASINANSAERAALRVALDAYLSMRAR